MTPEKIVKQFERGIWSWTEAAGHLRDMGKSDVEIIAALGPDCDTPLTPASGRSEYEEKVIAKWPCPAGFREATFADVAIFDRTQGRGKIIQNNRLVDLPSGPAENRGDAKDGTGRARIFYPASGLEVIEHLIWFVAKS